VNERERSAIAGLLALTSAELASLRERFPLIQRMVGDIEDEATSLGTIDLQDEGLVEATLSELDGDAEKLLGDG
jgi:hypothetical protein